MLRMRVLPRLDAGKNATKEEERRMEKRQRITRKIEVVP
jgi:hypothetical protein